MTAAMMTECSVQPRDSHKPALPMGAGVCLKPQHYSAVLESAERPAFFEVHAENYLCAGGPAHHYLEAIRRDSRLSIHGVGLSLAGPEAPSAGQLAARRALLDRYQPDEFSEHLAWTSFAGEYLNDLLPFAYTRASLDHVVAQVSRTQDALGRRILIENPATYLQFTDSTYSEAQFLTELVHRAGCGLLLDVNNVIVCAANHGFDAVAYLNELPLRQVAEVHLAGHAARLDSAGHALLIDSHDGPVQDDTWTLYEDLLHMTGPLPTLIEWDSQLPEWPRLRSEAAVAQHRLDQAGGARAAA
jgi:uncharacterized protein (UPF0276 family)